MASKVKVKICGLTHQSELMIVNKLLPDYVGFVFADSSRRVTVAEASQLSRTLDPRIKKVGVFVNAPPEFVRVAAAECNLDILQFHGDEPNDYWREFKQPVWKALSMRGQDDLALVSSFVGIEAILLDSPTGGSGKSFDWSLVQNLNTKRPLILAGGLRPENVGEGIKLVKPWAVDVSSGVETNGKKDFDKIKQFIENVRGLCDDSD